MNCEELQIQWLADPKGLDAEAKQHLLECMCCTEYTRAGLEREAKIAGAFNVPTDAELTKRILAQTAAQRATRPVRDGGLLRRWLPMAAAACLAVVVGIQMRSGPVGGGTALAAAVVEHIAHEPKALSGQLAQPAVAAVQQVMQRVGLAWDGAMDAIAYAEICPLEGKTMVHMVMQSDMGPVTVMITSGSERESINSAHGDWQLASVEINGGSAILAATSREALEMVEKQLRAQLRLSGTA